MSASLFPSRANFDQSFHLQRAMWLLGGSKLMFPLFLVLPHNTLGMDGCQGDHGGLYWRCGDVCTSAASSYLRTKQDCTCGSSTFGQQDGKWCCGGTNCTGGCLRWNRGYKDGDYPWYCAEWTPAICTTGVALNLTQKCQDTCNYYGEDKYRNEYNSRSYVAVCTNTSICVKEGEGKTRDDNYRPTICTGNSTCEGELAWCKKEERKNERCLVNDYGIQFTRCSPTLGGGKKKHESETNGIPGQCIDQEQSKDGKIYHCMDRTDENPFQEAVNRTNQQQIDFHKLKVCSAKFGYPGLEGCGNIGCIRMDFWCNDTRSVECPVLGAGIRTNNPTVCQDYKFWQDKPCSSAWNGIEWEDRIRCRAGYSGQCVEKYYWGVGGAKDFLGSNASCHDGSDLYRPIVKAEEPGRQPSQPESDPFKVPSVTVRMARGPRIVGSGLFFIGRTLLKDFYYVKDKTTNLRMAATTEKTCQDNDGFVCKVRLDTADMTNMSMMM